MTEEQEREIRLSIVEPELYQLLEALSNQHRTALAVKVNTAWLDAGADGGMSEMRQEVEKFSLETEEHLARYLANREKRTGQKWEVVERYHTGNPNDWRYDGWDRALIRAEDGSTLRIYYAGSCWRMGQKVLAPKRSR